MSILEGDSPGYHPDWPQISHGVLRRAAGRCECVGECRRHGGRCDARTGPQPSGVRVYFTLARLDHRLDNVDPDNLRAMCSPCQLAHDKTTPTAAPARYPGGQLSLLELI